MKTIITILTAVLIFAVLPDQKPVIRPADLISLTGERWIGTLSYLDYTSNRQVSIPSTLLVTGIEGQPSSFTFDYQYPDEPHARSTSTITIANDGREFAGEQVVKRQISAGGTLILVTEKTGRDNDREALIRHTYQIQPRSFSIRKEVRYTGTAAFLQRNEYRWER
jgi:hypothetical protein